MSPKGTTIALTTVRYILEDNVTARFKGDNPPPPIIGGHGFHNVYRFANLENIPFNLFGAVAVVLWVRFSVPVFSGVCCFHNGSFENVIKPHVPPTGGWPFFGRFCMLNMSGSYGMR